MQPSDNPVRSAISTRLLRWYDELIPCPGPYGTVHYPLIKQHRTALKLLFNAFNFNIQPGAEGVDMTCLYSGNHGPTTLIMSSPQSHDGPPPLFLAINTRQSVGVCPTPHSQ